MPELPEVDWCGRSLARWSAGRRVVAVEVLDPRSIRTHRTARPTDGHPNGRAAVEAVVLGRPPGPMERHGKRLLWTFGARALLLHLGMTGRWTRAATSFPKVRLHLDDGPPLTFGDPRLLGGVVPLELADGRAALRDELGPDALTDPLPPFRGRRPIKVVLMDQAVVAGLGNLHAAEALWRAGIAPTAPAESIVGARHTALAAGVHAQLEFARRLLDADEEVAYVEDAGAANPFPLYRRGGEPCPRCAGPIVRDVHAGRSTWWCPGCQT